MKIGIDKIGFAMPDKYLDIRDLANARGIDPDKFTKGLMQLEMAISPRTQDIVTLAARAAAEILNDEDKEKIDMIILGTETGVDQSKAASVFVHGLLGIQAFARSIEIKEACYGATAGLEMARNHVMAKPESRVLVIASDIAKYGVGSGGESTQGAGAIAMLIKKDPAIAVLNRDNVYQTRDKMDFWRPNYSPYPCVDGKFSTELYLDCLSTTWNQYLKENSKSAKDFKALCFHLPYPKLGLKGLSAITENLEDHHKEVLSKNFTSSILYSQRVGNIYTGSLYLGLLSLLENSENLKAKDSIALYSYGSGAVCEIFSIQLVEGFQKHLRKNRLTNDFDKREKLSIEEYEDIFFKTIEVDENGNAELEEDLSPYALMKIDGHKRVYRK
ncbi:MULTISPECIES: hydroxymethylglutaryl-CoA synthase [unclassified Gemella]|uniref:hydroxymethylglutaryl-CoA synthase n=1 Tax=unclassified Gemella TaxID=2624949 RepID=UPI0010737C54|nr:MULTISPECIES: hydroxymethylglutaryl-CoA synthase [unclassified Gemella]MBF0710536.1 hydroxymethylglutaryl-CoA synthase [Gemella sp. GL1.1]MBF0747213.1 hydroxymethylglutaryl-CoA synthase [Gemella sp. 19428wG2_WT2a]NYS27880.1 hydroxymethylglutaryl-CoA synthase [Gemella sp. GL1]TFU58008.1 hydroxymethylglutaryl-CoA synthase [Gemella sp. WT2a]